VRRYITIHEAGVPRLLAVSSGEDRQVSGRSAKRYARELVKTYAEVDDLAAAGIELVDDVVLPANVEAEIDQLAEMRREAEVLRHDVAIETRRATQQLRRAGFSTRDVGEILGISSARVAQIEREAPAV
jgi:hypothetical protein